MTRTRKNRRGSVYVAVLGAAMIVATIALASSSMGRLALHNASDQRDRRQAQIAARSGIEYALGWINGHSDWRTQLSSGVESGELTSNKVRFTWSVTDEDGNLADDVCDHAVIRAVGSSKTARSVLTLSVEPSATSLTCLESALHASGAITMNTGASVRRSGAVTSNSTSAYLASPAKTMPGGDVWDYYISRGTAIPISSLPTSFGVHQFTLRVLSRQLNPFGETNPWGIYVIDCQGANVDLSFCRVYGTLVLLNAGPNTAISDVAIFQPEVMNYPSLMVQGDLRIDLKHATEGAVLRENGRMNYNPVGAPYGTDGVDSDISDNNRPATLDGVVYVTGAVRFADDAVIRGSLVADSVAVDAGKILTLQYWPYAKNYPPPGFTVGSGVRPLPGSWREVGL